MSDDVRYINPPNAGPPQGLYTHVGLARPGDFAFIAGQLAVDKDGNIIGKNDFEAQFHAVFGSLGTVLNDLGASYDCVTKFTTYLVHSQDIEKFMGLRAALFPKLFTGDLYAPNTLLVVDRLVREEFLIEVEATARIPG